MTLMSVLFDLAMLGILIGCAAYYAHKGFLASLVSFFGTVLSIVVAVLLARYLAPVVFDHLLRPGLEARVTEAISGQALTTVADVLRSVLDFLPEAVIEAVAASVGTTVDFAAAEVSSQLVTQVVQPFVVPLLILLLFLILFLLLRFVVFLLGKLLSGVNKLPVVGTLNGALGAVMGVLLGVLYVFLLLCAIWLLDAVFLAGSIQGDYLAGSVVLRLMAPFNFFT